MVSIAKNSAVFDEHPELFHYTSGNGLEGILRTNTLWATDIHSLNDLQEQHHFYDNVLPNLALLPLNHAIEKLRHRTAFKRLVKDMGMSGARKHLFDRTIAEFKATALTMHRNFVLSFCCPGDDSNIQRHGLLSQWRAYGGENSYAIVFDQSLHSAFAQDLISYRGESSLFGDVWYGDFNNEMSLPVEFQRSLTSIRNGLREHFDGKKLSDDQSFFQSLTHLACFSKHWGFSEEREVRLLVCTLGSGMPVSLIEDDTRLSRNIRSRRIGANAEAQFIEIFGYPRSSIKLPIKKIIVGPSNNPVIAMDFARQAMNASGYGNIPLLISEIPYRPPHREVAREFPNKGSTH